ncbi:MAG: hypothetical protein RL678_99 [Pseudomonadota bacterium]
MLVMLFGCSELPKIKTCIDPAAGEKTFSLWCWQARGQLVDFLSGAAGGCVPVRLTVVRSAPYRAAPPEPRLARIIGQFTAVVIARAVAPDKQKPGSFETGLHQFGCGDRI